MRFSICLAVFVVLGASIPSLSQSEDVRTVQSALERREQACAQLRTEWYLVKHLPSSTSAPALPLYKRDPLSTSRTTLTVSGWEGGFVCRSAWTAHLLSREGDDTPTRAPSQLEMWEEMVILKRSPYASIVKSPLYLVGQRPKERVPHVYRLYLSGAQLDSGLMAVTLTGLNPLRLLAPDIEVKPLEAKVLLTGRLMPDITVGRYVSPEVHFVLDPMKGYAPVAIRARQGDFFEEITVTGWKKFAGTWIPQTVRCDLRVYTLMRIRSQCQLKSVRGFSGACPEWLKEGVVVRDVRLGEPGVLYALKRDELPSIKVLKKTQEEQNEREKSAVMEQSLPMKSLPPLLLITIGVLWYWRLRRAEGKR